MNKRIIGLAFIAVALAFGVGVALIDRGGPDPLTQAIRQIRPEEISVLAFVGGEKRLLLEDPEVQRLLCKEHGLTVDARKAGSIEMVSDPQLLAQKPDLLWPASDVVAQIGKERGLHPIKEDIVFSTPIVLFSWSPVAEALVKAGIAQPIAGSAVAYRVDSKALIGMIRDKATWAGLGLDAIYGTVMIYTTDPARSNSGNQFASLLAVMLADGQREPQAIRAALPQMATIFRRMGYMEQSSFDLFDQYLRTGMTAKPIIAAYENQLIEFAALNPDVWKAVSTQPIHPVILYPEPTLFASHAGLAMTANGVRMLDAMRDPQLLDLAWRRHGFRSGLAAAADTSALPFAGIPTTVPQVIAPPPLDVVEEIVAAVAGHP